jgi:putative heme-binding domain-containing protein
MRLSPLARWVALSAGFIALVGVSQSPAGPQRKNQPAQKKQEPSMETAEKLMTPSPRPKKPALPPSKLPLEFVKGERIAFVGNGTAERMSHYGFFETFLHLRYPDKELVIRNFARPADEVALRQRPNDYFRLDDPMYAFNPDTILCFFGMNESFKGPAGVEQFKADYEKFIDDYTKFYPRDDAGSPPRFVLVTPTAFEFTGNPYWPEGTKENANLKLYSDAVKAVGAKRKLAVVDLYAPTYESFSKNKGRTATDDGIHMNKIGDQMVATLLDVALAGSENPGAKETLKVEKLRAAVNDKSWVHAQDYRMLNGWYVYGGRRTWDTETFPREFVKIRNMAAVRDRYVWDIAQDKPVADKPDDSKTGDLVVPPTRFGDPRQKYSEADTLRYLSPDDFIKSCTLPPGFELKLFADEKQFPELAKPVQLSFDNKGRLWVATMPTYPMWKPGDPKPMDKILILEDTDGDGRADKCTVFYEGLHCPTGFEFFDGGVIVVDQPRLIFLKDTDGDDKADLVVTLFDGWATEDTHHTINAFEMSNGGLLHMLEGISMSTTVETPWGPFRNSNTSGAYVVDPRTLKVRHFNTPGYGNPWCYVFNEWGQGFCGDGTGAQQHWDTPLSGAQYQGRQSLQALFDTESMRPVVGSEFLYSRHFPNDVQGQFIYACVINMNGIPRWTIANDGGGYKGTRVRHDPADRRTPYDLIRSTDKHFRPVDPQIGPDGALWFGDWANALIGHMQYSQRDPNKDHTKGRIYRLVFKDKPLLTPVTQFGKSERELLDQFREYEWRTRYRARAELRARPADAVQAAVKEWVAKLDPSDPAYDRLRCEALWVQQSRHKVDPALLKAVLAAKTPDARAAAVRVAADEREYLADVFPILAAAATDESPRVRCEACRGLSFYPTLDAVRAVVTALQQPQDYWVRYTADAALGANLGVWQGAHLKGDLAQGNAAVKRVLDNVIATDKKGAPAVPYLKALLGTDPLGAETKSKYIQALADLPGGNVGNGRKLFLQHCTACHKVDGQGQEYGPQMDGNPDGKGPVGKRLTRYKIVESIIDPNAEVDAKYLSTKVVTLDGKTVIGLLLSETKDEVVIFDSAAKEKKTIKTDNIDSKTQLKQSSMPDGLAGTISAGEFLDVVAFLASLK